jgi:hypothetical protein
MSLTKSIYQMNRQELIDHANYLECRIEIYSERDWLVTESCIVRLKQVDLLLLDMYTNDTIEKDTICHSA